MEKVIKYIRVHRIFVNGEVVDEYQTPYTSKERLLDICRLKDKGFSYDRSKRQWCVRYNDFGYVQYQTIRYQKIKYI